MLSKGTNRLEARAYRWSSLSTATKSEALWQDFFHCGRGLFEFEAVEVLSHQNNCARFQATNHEELAEREPPNTRQAFAEG